MTCWMRDNHIWTLQDKVYLFPCSYTTVTLCHDTCLWTSWTAVGRTEVAINTDGVQPRLLRKLAFLAATDSIRNNKQGSLLFGEKEIQMRLLTARPRLKFCGNAHFVLKKYCFVLFIRYCWSDKSRENGRDGAQSTHGVLRHVYETLSGK
jgi:hypothetical protein